MEFEDDHEEDQEEEEEEEESEMAITPTFQKQQNLTASSNVRYRECLKNHAVGVGGLAVDGCGEFMAAGAEGSIDALRCAACNCHRNFHRKEFSPPEKISIPPPPHHNNNQLTLYSPRPHHPHQIYQLYPYNRTTPLSGLGYQHLHVTAPQRAMNLGSPTEVRNMQHGQQQKQEMTMGDETATGVGFGGTMTTSPGGCGGSNSSGKNKRFRTKFTQEQKDKMLELAEKLGWKIQKEDENAVQQFCNETGVKRHVLKVWMHNNKHTLGKKP
ncbi:unnamed protein product [Amaranthus hypochondriacus]